MLTAMSAVPPLHSFRSTPTVSGSRHDVMRQGVNRADNMATMFADLEAVMSGRGRGNESLAYMNEEAYCCTNDEQQIHVVPCEDTIEGRGIVEGCQQSDIAMDDAVQQHMRPCSNEGSHTDAREAEFSTVRRHRWDSRHLTYQRHHTDHNPSNSCRSKECVGHAMEGRLIHDHVGQRFQIDHHLGKQET
jgi:hypothetical protein